MAIILLPFLLKRKISSFYYAAFGFVYFFVIIPTVIITNKQFSPGFIIAEEHSVTFKNEFT